MFFIAGCHFSRAVHLWQQEYSSQTCQELHLPWYYEVLLERYKFLFFRKVSCNLLVYLFLTVLPNLFMTSHDVRGEGIPMSQISRRAQLTAVFSVVNSDPHHTWVPGSCPLFHSPVKGKKRDTNTVCFPRQLSNRLHWSIHLMGDYSFWVRWRQNHTGQENVLSRLVIC